MWKRILAFGGLLLALFLLGPSQVAAQTIDEQMTALEDEIWNSLVSCKQSSQSLIEELEDLRKLQAISQETLTELSSSLENTLDLCNSYASDLQTMRVKLDQQKNKTRKLAMCLILIAAIAVLVRVATIILKAKFGIQLPYWLNVIL